MKTMRKGRKCPKCGYEKNAPEAAWCGLCYEPFNRHPAAEERPAANPPAPVPAKTAPGARLLFFVIPALLGAALALFQFQQSRSGAPAGVSPQAGRLAGKTAEADRLLARHSAEQASFLAELETGELDPEGFGAEGGYTKRLFRLEDGYANAINALALPCPSCVDKDADRDYLDWTRDFQAREAAAMKDFNTRYAALALKAAALRKP